MELDGSKIFPFSGDSLAIAIRAKNLSEALAL
jgi:hypothetical protein